MTQESPLTVCHDCQTPMKAPAGQVRGEYYCEDCLEAAVRRMTAEGKHD